MSERFTVDRAVEPAVSADVGVGPVGFDESDIEPVAQPTRLRTARDVYRWLPRIPGWSVAAIDGRITMSPAGGVGHALGMTAFVVATHSVAKERDWIVFGGTVDVCFFPRRDTYVPDLVIAPQGCRTWGDDLHSAGVLLVGEIVSPGTTQVDRIEKPATAARAGIPIMLLVDPIGRPASVIVYSRPVDGRYEESITVDLGVTVHLPAPVDLDLDTSIFIRRAEA
ncbi:Uma2 family endonuclease [Spongiactinospora sp. 9N601]|uniref:Uma2 family endonuclease n=1 Tax=Spongiactinospora sp. 9N601 TaxID=3375149 RepID=UPI00379EE596